MNHNKNTDKSNAFRFSVAPMLDWTDRHCRYFHRIMTKKTLLYTEMVTTGAIIHGDQARHLYFDHAENPVALQLGGCDPVELAMCAKLAEDYGYTEINLNCGCPSNRVQKGAFGACLMREPELVAECLQAMQKVVKIPVTLKTRIGIDHEDSYEFLQNFVRINADAGCQYFTIHARKAWLSGLSPKENREIPPLDYERVYRIKRDFPNLTISINGGILDLAQATQHLEQVDGVMIGRKAYHEPFILNQVDHAIFNTAHDISWQINAPNRFDIAEKMIPYIENHLKKGGKLQQITRHMLGLFHGQHGGRLWRRALSENAWRNDADINVFKKALIRVAEHA